MSVRMRSMYPLIAMTGFFFFQSVSFACDPNQIDKFIVLRHANGTHLIDNKLNSLNHDEEGRAHGVTISEADLTLGGITDQLKEVAASLKKQGVRSDNICVISSENV